MMTILVVVFELLDTRLSSPKKCKYTLIKQMSHNLKWRVPIVKSKSQDHDPGNKAMEKSSNRLY